MQLPAPLQRVLTVDVSPQRLGVSLNAGVYSHPALAKWSTLESLSVDFSGVLGMIKHEGERQ